MPVRMAIIKKSGNNRCWKECGEIGTLLHCWCEFNHCRRQCGDSSMIQKQKYHQTQQSHYWVYIQRIINHSIIKTQAHGCSLQPCLQYQRPGTNSKCPSRIDWTKKIWHTYTMEYYAAIKKDKFMSFAGTWMKLETIILSKLTQEHKTKYHMFL